VALGYYGHTPAPVDPELQAECAKRSGKEVITCRPADRIKPGMQDLRDKLAAKGLPVTDENCVIYAMFPQQLEDYYAGKKPEPPTNDNFGAPAALTTVGVSAAISGRNMKLNIMGREYDVVIEEK